MTNQEAIEKFKKIKKGNIFLIHQRIEGKEVFDDYSLCDMAITALEKQIPMEPLEKEYSNDLGENIHVYVIPCGKCGHAINFLHSYCPWCGQAIDWSEGEG